VKPIRVYADTSVFGGIHDSEFAQVSREFFSRVWQGRIQIVVSTSVLDELEDAPEAVRKTWEEILPLVEVLEVTDYALNLQEAYLRAGVVTPKWDQDALHVAMATLSRCAMIVSWNFRHIVNYQKIPQYNAVNAVEGYGPISIYSPLEVVTDETD
jgi:hypothetical protein